ncbi:actin binding protein [Planoprotostelium fungivorum]|uniref:Actin binding protein n=1 Tax=Planoprotostelium fungivorum TaxID=1890364 RepID=A0A2P6N0T7_9EUKA|nr:actin binding protein [Planoprotostelium fungivorum]
MEEQAVVVKTLPSLVDLCLGSVITEEGFVTLHTDAIKALPVELIQRFLSFTVKTVQSKLLTAEIPLKIKLRHNRLITFRFKLHGTVADTIREVFDKAVRTETNSSEINKYGLFQRGTKFCSNRWLDPCRTLSHYDLKPGDVLDFRTMYTLLRVQFLGPWTTVKTFIIDESKTVAELTREIGEKLEVSNPEEFSLQIQREFNGEYYQGVWLNPNKSLSEQNVDILNTTLLLRKKFFYNDVDINEFNDNEGLTRHFWQILDAIVAGTTICTIYEAIKLAALQCQIRFGDCTVPQEGFLENVYDEYLPPDYVQRFGKISGEIYKEYKALSGINSTNAKYRYILHARALKTYAFTFFKVEKVQTDGASHSIFLGISRDRIIHVDADTKEVLWSSSLFRVAQWKSLNHHLFIDYIDFAEHYSTQEVDAVCQTLWDYASKTYKRLNQPSTTTPTGRVETEESTETPGSPPLSCRMSISSASHNNNQVIGAFTNSPSTSYTPLVLSPNNDLTQSNALLRSLSTSRSMNSSNMVVSSSPSSGNVQEPLLSTSPGNISPTPPRRDTRRSYYSALGSTAIAVLNPTPQGDREHRPSSPPQVQWMTLKQRESTIKKKRAASDSEGTGEKGSTLHRRSPLYEDPNRTHINPLFDGGVSVPYHPSDEINYCLKMIRCLNCLLTSLKNQNEMADIQVMFPNKSIKTIQVDGNKTVCDLSVEIAEKVGIKNPEEFSLQSAETETWLNPYQTLRSQGLPKNSVLVFKKKFHYNDAFITHNDPVYFNLLFCQCRDAIRSGTYTCNLDEAVQLAATNLQINFGDYNPNIHQPGFLKFNDLQFFLPTEYLDFWGVTFQKLEKMIYKEHQKLRGIKEEFAKYRYLLLCRNLRTYGTAFFQVKLTAHHGKAQPKLPLDTMFIGFSRDSISFTTAKAKRVLHEYPLTHIRCWEGKPDSLKLDFGDHVQGTMMFETTEGMVISNYLSDYVDFVQKNWMSTQTFNPQIFKYPPEEFNGLCFAEPFCWENGKRVFTSSFFTDY